MIAWLSEWLKEIVVIVLLAVFVDLVLPNRSMQRYVKVVLSLLILLAILSPLVEFLHSGDRLNAWLQANPAGGTGQAVPVAGDMPSLRTISKEAEQMTAERNRQALELAQLRLEAAAVRALEDSLAIRKAEVSAVLRPGAAAGEVLLEDMAVRLWPRAEEEEAAVAEVPRDSGKPAEIAPVEPIAPVIVSIRDEPLTDGANTANQPDVTQHETDEADGPDGAPDMSAAAGNSLHHAALDVIEEQFDIPPDKVRVSVEARR